MNISKKDGELGYVRPPFEIPFKRPVEQVASIARHSDGRLYVAFTATVIPWDSPEYSRNSIVVVRLNTTGSPDPDYGTAGFAQVSFDKLPEFTMGAYILAMELDEQGKVTVLVRDTAGAFMAGLVRFKPDGQLDETFGKAGTIVHRLNISADHTHSASREPSDARHREASGQLTPLASGALIYASTTAIFPNPGFGFMARFRPDGTLDTSFGNNGIVQVAPPGSAGLSIQLWSVTELSDGRIVACGHIFSERDEVQPKGLLARYTADGVLDPTFGNDGFVLYDPPQHYPADAVFGFMCQSAAEGPDLSLVCVFTLILRDQQSPRGTVVAHLDKDGVDVLPFNKGKPVLFSVIGHSVDHFHRVVVQHHGDNTFKIVAAGRSNILRDGPGQSEFLMARFNANGTRDHSFAVNGWINKQFAPGINSLSALTLEPRAIIAAGVNGDKAVVMLVNG